MNHSIVSTCHSIQLIPIDLISLFARIDSRVIIHSGFEPMKGESVPGTIKVSGSKDGNIIAKTINFQHSDTSLIYINLLERCKNIGLVATYIDEKGYHRISGSPDYPLTLDYATEGGVVVVTLTGKDTQIDGYITD